MRHFGMCGARTEQSAIGSIIIFYMNGGYEPGGLAAGCPEVVKPSKQDLDRITGRVFSLVSGIGCL